MAPTNPLLLASEAGQSIWLDNLTRDMVREGGLQKLVREDGVSGVTSNPAIFSKAMTQGSAYDDQMRRLAEEGMDALAIYETMAIEDIQGACDVLRPVFERTNGTDGFVSLEVSPHLARDTDGTVVEARRLWKAVNRPNVLIKIPGTVEGVPAIRQCLTEGISINVTLLFSLDAYRSVMEAHLAALEARKDAGKPLATVASVASFFLSRIDTLIDKQLDAIGSEEAAALRGKVAVASAKLAYRMWKETYSGPRWEALAEAGARVQKPLWASTSTKDDAYSDVKYVEPLIGPQTINTVPDETLEAFRDHGKVGHTIQDGQAEAEDTLRRLEMLGISLKQATDELVEEGIAKFVRPFEKLLDALDEKRKNLVG